MNTQFAKILIYFLLVTVYNGCSAQSLFVDGRFFNDDEKQVTATYTLMCNNKIIKTDKARKIKTKLDLNEEYTLLISKENFQTRSIRFSTNAQTGDRFVFAFDVTLYKNISEQNCKIIYEAPFVNVYYDTKINRFNYSFIHKNQSHY